MSWVATVFPNVLNGYVGIMARMTSTGEGKMKEDTPNTVGVDISKAHLDAHRLRDGEAAQFDNDACGFEELAHWVGAAHCVVYEATGRYHRDFEEALVAAGIPLARANPLRARRFAQSMGRNAKTDAVDAAVLARMGAALDLHPTAPADRALRDLSDLTAAREALVRDRVAVLNRREGQRIALLRQQGRQRRAQLDRQIKALDAEIARTLAHDERLARRAESLASIPGVGRTTAAALLAAMPELGGLDAKAAASLAGLAPVARESGQWQGKRFIQGGRARVRRLLYMATLAAIRHNPDLARKYRALVDRGKPPKVALTAVMRKLLLLANALLRHNRLWTPRADMPGAQPAENAAGPKGQTTAAAPSAGIRARSCPGHPLPLPA